MTLHAIAQGQQNTDTEQSNNQGQQVTRQ